MTLLERRIHECIDMNTLIRQQSPIAKEILQQLTPSALARVLECCGNCLKTVMMLIRNYNWTANLLQPEDVKLYQDDGPLRDLELRERVRGVVIEDLEAVECNDICRSYQNQISLLSVFPNIAHLEIHHGNLPWKWRKPEWYQFDKRLLRDIFGKLSEQSFYETLSSFTIRLSERRVDQVKNRTSYRDNTMPNKGPVAQVPLPQLFHVNISIDFYSDRGSVEEASFATIFNTLLGIFEAAPSNNITRFCIKISPVKSEGSEELDVDLANQSLINQLLQVPSFERATRAWVEKGVAIELNGTNFFSKSG